MDKHAITDFMKQIKQKTCKQQSMKNILIIYSLFTNSHHGKGKRRIMCSTKYNVSRFWVRYKRTYSSDKRIISFLNKICQCCTTVNYSPSSVVRYWKYSWINWERLPIDSNTLKIQVVMRPEIWSTSQIHWISHRIANYLTGKKTA